LGVGAWGIGPNPHPQSPIPNPQSPKNNLEQKKIKIIKNNI